MITHIISERSRARLLYEGLQIARQQGLERLLGDSYRVFVRTDEATQKVHYSFRAQDDCSEDDLTDMWIQLR